MCCMVGLVICIVCGKAKNGLKEESDVKFKKFIDGLFPSIGVCKCR